MKAVPDETLDTIVLSGTPDEVRQRCAERWAGVYEHILRWPPAFAGMDGVRAVIDTFARPRPTGAWAVARAATHRAYATRLPAAERRQQLLQAAGRVLAHGGYPALTMEAVAL
ncbi:hypothetical protein NBH00_10980 [Paraconexibacter antarcticus]|uniref:Uncharacterized protein n=1 Tax=Paraconexibacter antarcticus TaxID=2949664 RepID=A0ABY5DYS1_9ACTN|nr:hypothetical protein [Paraconexibacter antarcticus]UTI66709.1 hypothetical protein NBH00_10980 [Paraconexibacter antarcticus]